MGKAPCCDKANVKRGPWSPEEDAKLKSYIEQHGTGGNWIALPQKIGLKRCGKSCRLRWLNYLRPNIKHGAFSEEEDNIICSLYISIGSRWSIIAAQLPGRTDNDIKNYWNTRLKKKLFGKQHRKGSSSNTPKQEMKRGNGNIIPTMVNSAHDNNQNQNPYWPELPLLAPIPHSNQEPRLNDHESIRKLRIKLAGRFSNDYDDQLIRYATNPNPNPHPHPQQFPNHNISYNCSHQLSDHHQPHINNNNNNNALNESTSVVLFPQAQDFPVRVVEEMAYNVNPQRLDGLDFLLADNMLNDPSVNGTSSSSGEITTSLVYDPAMPSNCEGMQQRLLMHMQECAVYDHHHQLRYPAGSL